MFLVLKVQSLSFARANVYSSDTRNVVDHTVDSSNTRKVATDLNELDLSNRFEVLATNSDVNLDMY